MDNFCLIFTRGLTPEQLAIYTKEEILASVPADEALLRNYMNGDYKIIRRDCPGCADSQKEIFYKRLSPVPEDLNMIDLFQSNWISNANVMFTDFTLHSTLAEAQAGTGAWSSCFFDLAGVGFPFNCAPSPSYAASWQWNSFTGYGSGLNYGPPVAFTIYNEAVDACPDGTVSGPTALEEKWRVGPFAVTEQTLSLKYGSIGDEDATKRVIELYARPTSSGGPTNTDNENIDLNCFGESGVIQNSSPPGFGIETTTNEGETLLAITFKRATGDSIETFDGYDGTDSNAPTVEFCVKVTLGGKIFRQLAVKYTFTLDGAIEIDNAVVFNEDGTSENILKTLEYGSNAYLCDVAGAIKTESGQVVTGESIYICLESDNEQASVSSVSDLKLTALGKEQTVVSTDEKGAVTVSNLAIESCADGKCKYQVILDQAMFEAIASEQEGTITISVTGEANMEFGTLGIRRSLKIAPSKEERSLEEVVGDISGEFEVTAANGVGSSAAARLGGGMLITTLVVAAFNLML
jgi:hypothetical protein